MTSLGLGMPTIRRDPAQMPPTHGRPDVAGLVDRFGREARDLRVSITEKCSLRCTYCMPEAGLPAIARNDLLTATEIGRLVGIAVRDLGVRDVRFTGGEPLMRNDLVEIIARSAEVADGASISMTTNGIGLDKRVDALVAAGLNRVNISLDTVDRDHFARLTRRDRLPANTAGIAGAKAAGLTPLKINAVLMRDTLNGAVDLLEWSIANGVRLRFIEQMPLDADEAWARDNMIDAAELLAVLGERFTLTKPHREDPSAPAEEWIVDGGPATVGIIASVTLRGLRPHQAHRRGHRALVPLRRRRDRPARPDARRRRRPDHRRLVACRHVGQAGRSRHGALRLRAPGAQHGGDRWLRPG
jgi:cyclic pyranopterin phosphate synthase